MITDSTSTDLTSKSFQNCGTFVVSLDFELYWGMFDQTDLTTEYRDVLMRTREQVIPQLLELFEQYDVHSTWASVGLLFFENRKTLLASLPTIEATYVDESLSAYRHLASVGENEQVDPFHYAPSLLKMIQGYPHQEIASHSFSHYYCLEEGQSPEMFESDLEAWRAIAKQYDVEATSICFARNQYAPSYLSTCRTHGIKAYRGNENIWFYRPDSYKNERISRKICRWLDTYLPISAHQCTSWRQLTQQYPYNIQSSRFLRSYFHKLRWLEPLKQQRILAGMTHAAKQNQIYHLWWHPQDFGQDGEENFRMLARILEHYAMLRTQYGMVSANMSEIAFAMEQAKGTS